MGANSRELSFSAFWRLLTFFRVDILGRLYPEPRWGGGKGSFECLVLSCGKDLVGVG